jgi:hypothetical protein
VWGNLRTFYFSICWDLCKNLKYENKSGNKRGKITQEIRGG